MKDDCETQVKSSSGDAAADDPRPRVIPLDLGLAYRPFNTSSKNKCYIVDDGPPKTLTEIPCENIVIISGDDNKFTI